MATTRILLEVAVASVEDALAAERGGADRLELSLSLEQGGLTPPPDLVAAVLSAVRLPVVVMVRPHARGFCYSDSELDAMACSLDELPGPHVMGALTPGGEVDVQAMRPLMRGPVVFHRAFDETRDPFAALEAIIGLGCVRLLTSGQHPTALEGGELIRRLVGAAAGRIEILPGAGIRSGNVAEIVRRTGCKQVHGTFCDRATGRTDEAEVRRVRVALDALSDTPC